MSEQKPAPKKMTMIIVCILLGNLGVHRFMTGHTGRGVLALLTFGLCSILTWIDLFAIITGKYRTADGQPLSE